AERDPHEADPIDVALPQAGDHPVEIAGLARVVEPREAIDLSAAGAEVHDGGAPPQPPRPVQEPARVVRARGALEAVEDQQQRAGRGRVDEPVHVQEVAVGRLEALAAHRRLPPVSEQRPPERLEMAAPVPERGVVVLQFFLCGRPRPHRRMAIYRLNLWALADYGLTLQALLNAGAQTWPPHSPAGGPPSKSIPAVG